MLKTYIFMMSISITILSKKLTLSVCDSVFEHKYENKYDIDDIRPYPTRFHPYLPRGLVWADSRRPMARTTDHHLLLVRMAADRIRSGYPRISSLQVSGSGSDFRPRICGFGYPKYF